MKNSLKHYILEGKKPVECGLFEWARFLESDERIVKVTEIGGGKVSTVFLGLDHNFCDEGPPLLFETMVFVEALPEMDQNLWRCATWAEAERLHEEVCEKVRAAVDNKDEQTTQE